MNSNLENDFTKAKPGFFARWFCKRRLKQVGFVLVGLITLGFLVYNIEVWRGRHKLQQYISEFEAKGERFDRESVIPPAVPEDQNMAMIPLFKQIEFSLKTRNTLDSSSNDKFLSLGSSTNVDRPASGIGRWDMGKKVDLTAWQDYFRRYAGQSSMADKQSTNMSSAARIVVFPIPLQPSTPAQDVIFALSAYDGEFAQLENAISRPFFRFPIPYMEITPDNFGDGFISHLGKMKSLQQTLTLRSCALLADGQKERAYTNTILQFRVMDGIANQPFLISFLVRVAMQHIGLQAVWEAIATHSWNESQLAAIQLILEKSDVLGNYRLAIRGERNILASMITGPGSFESGNAVVGKIDKETSNPYLKLPKAFAFHSLVSMYQMYAVLLSFEPGKTEENHRLVENYKATRGGWGYYHILADMMLPALDKAIFKVEKIQMDISLATAGCALERYRLADGHYPDSLQTLCPRFLAQVPLDPMSGNPILYKKGSNGEVAVYSVGDDKQGRWWKNETGKTTIQIK